MIEGTRCVLLPFCMEFAEELARAANNPNVACNLLDTFPHPYTLLDARAWVSMCQHEDNGRRFCICVEREEEAEAGAEEEQEGEQASNGGGGEESARFAPDRSIRGRRSRWLPVGCIEAMNTHRGGGSNFAHRVELGYWLAESHWGRGIMTDAVAAFVSYLFSDDFAQRWNDGQAIIR
jgi:RimJ/RimL family protein N-acetyltransferase